jgi:hypothetical protein
MIDKQRKAAMVTGLVLAAMAIGIYLVVILQFMTH